MNFVLFYDCEETPIRGTLLTTGRRGPTLIAQQQLVTGLLQLSLRDFVLLLHDNPLH
jgi:hypothetical protein